MTDPKRLVEDADLGATLLASAHDDAPSRAARHRAAAALGIGIATAAVTTTVATGASAGAGTAGAGAKVAGVSLWVKLVAGGIAVATVSGGTIAVTRSSSPPAEVVAAPAPVAPKIAHTAAPAPVAPAEAETTEPPRVAPAPRATHAASHAQPAPSADSPLAKELKSLDAARAHLDQGNPSAALAEIDRHDRAFPRGALGTEAAVLRIEALHARGDTAAAKKLARDLLARDPSGPHAKRLRSIADAP